MNRKLHQSVGDCLRKARYRTEDKAQKTARKFGQRVYYCAQCCGFHLTKQEVPPQWAVPELPKVL